VTADQGNGLPGVNVLLKGSTTGTTTDSEGNYALNVTDTQANGTLVFSFIGYLTEEIAIGNRNVLNVSLLPDIKSLSEVVVVGYGTQEKKELTGAVSSVRSEDIRQVAVTGLDQALQGRAPGVVVTNNSGEPGGSVSVKIRGVGSINGSSEPLYIIDGIPVEGGLNAINPNDIERIDILKDAGAAAIYGSRASNGVVVVTTRQGKTGKLTVDLDAYLGVQSLAKKFDLLNSAEFVSLAGEALTNTQNDPRASVNKDIPGPNPAWNDLAQWADTDWQDEVFRKGLMQSYNLTLTGGTEKFRSSTMLGYFKTDGIYRNSNYERYTFRSNNTFNATPWLRFGLNSSVAKERKKALVSDRSGDVFIGAVQLATRALPLMPVQAPNDGLFGNDVFYGFKDYAFISRKIVQDPVQQYYYPGNAFNPVYFLNYSLEPVNDSWRLLASPYAEVDLLKGLTFKTMLNVDLDVYRSLYGERKADPNINSTQTGTGYFANGTGLTWNWVNTLTYEKTLGRHALSLLAGTDALSFNGTTVNTTGQGYDYDEYFVLNNASTKTASGVEDNRRLISYIGRVNYAFAGKYLLTFNIRRDASSNFGPGNRWGTFPSASVGWRLSEEPFLKPLSWLSELKLRASYGVLGNQRIPPFKYLNTYSDQDFYSTYNYFRQRYVLGDNQTPQYGYAPTNLSNPNIKWEASVQTDVGLDAAFFDNKLSLTLDYYVKRIEDMLGYEPVPVTFGAPGNARFYNFASMENRGVEMALGYRTQMGGVKLSVDANAATYANKVTNIGLSKDISSGFGRLENASTRTVVGEPVAQFYGYLTDGLFQNESEIAGGPAMPNEVVPGDRRYKDVNGRDAEGKLTGQPDGKIDDADRVYLGNALPKWTAGLNLRAEYGGFDFSLFVQGQFGNKIAADFLRYLHDIRNYNGGGFQNASREVLGRWHGEGTSHEMPRLGYSQTASNFLFSDYYVRKGDFVRVRNVQLGYTLPAALSGKLGLSRLRLYVSGQNLLTFSKYPGYDPEVGNRSGDNGNVLLGGVDSGRYPASRVVISGLNVSF
jgi:TonB-linked SusC/RagA family outer membrane protein